MSYKSVGKFGCRVLTKGTLAVFSAGLGFHGWIMAYHLQMERLDRDVDCYLQPVMLLIK